MSRGKIDIGAVIRDARQLATFMGSAAEWARDHPAPAYWSPGRNQWQKEAARLAEERLAEERREEEAAREERERQAALLRQLKQDTRFKFKAHTESDTRRYRRWIYQDREEGHRYPDGREAASSNVDPLDPMEV